MENNNKTYDDALLQDFFAPAREQQLSDDGFTERVMQRLEAAERQKAAAATASRMSRAWTWFCIVVGVVAFIAFRGWETILIGLKVFVQTAPLEYNPLGLMLAFVVLCVVGVAEVLRHEERLSF
jgi:uncharacterized membrane protein